MTGDATSDTEINRGGEGKEIMDEKVEEIENVLGERLEAYCYLHDELYLRFEDGSILQWSGYYSRPLDADNEELRDIWEERIEWKEAGDGMDSDQSETPSDTEIEQAVERLEELAEMDDVEKAHEEADEILLESVPEEIAEAYEDVPKWYT